MPLRSEAQRKLMQRVLDGQSDKVPRAVAEQYLAADTGGELPEHSAKKRMNRSGTKKRKDTEQRFPKFKRRGNTA